MQYAEYPVRKVLLLNVPQERMAELRKAFQAAGFEPTFVANPRDAFAQLHRAANIDAIVIDYAAPEAELPYLLTLAPRGFFWFQLRND